MSREGYIIVERIHPLFPNDVGDAIISRVSEILSEIESRHSVRIRPLKFKLQAQAASARTTDQVIKAVFSDTEHPNVRMIFSETPLTKGSAVSRFSKNDLFVSITESGGDAYSASKGLAGLNSGCIHTGATSGRRIIEDLLVDIHLGNYFRQTGPLAEMVKQTDLPTAYRKKAKFARNHPTMLGSGRISSDATYAILSLLSSASDDDVARRADDAYTEWVRFVTSISAFKFPTSNSLARKKNRPQLATPKLNAAAMALPPGTYRVLQLKKSMVRVSRKMHDSLVSLFKPYARPNTFRIVGIDDYAANIDLIKNLVRDGHIVVYELSRTPEDFTLI